MTTLVSIVVPFFNEEDGIPRLTEKLISLRRRLAPKYDTEFVLVDDGSRDGSAEVARKSLNGIPNTVVVTHEHNRGLGAALRTGFASARGEILCPIDADCTYDPSEVERLLEALEQRSADIASGSPYHPRGGVENVTHWRLWLSQGASWIYRQICPGKLYTYTCMVRAQRRHVIDSVTFDADGFEAVAEMLLRALCQGYEVVEVPMILRSRLTGVSKMRTLRTIRKHMRLMLRVLGWRLLGTHSAPGRLRANQDVIS